MKEVRIDQYIANTTEYSRSKIEKAFKDNLILVNGVPVKKSYILKSDDDIFIPTLKEEELSTKGNNIPLDIVYEDDDVIVINKQNGLVVHPAVGNADHTLVNALIYHNKRLSGVNGNIRPGIVHRIDAYTTGLLLVAKNDFSHASLAKQIEEKTVKRTYYALVWGVISEEFATIHAPIGRDKNQRKKMCVTDENSKDAITHFKVLERYENASLLEVNLETGRTHQIRVHMDYIHHPIVNDAVYGNRKIIDDTGQCLHAKKIEFKHPRTNEILTFEVDLPPCFLNILNKFKD